MKKVLLPILFGVAMVMCACGLHKTYAYGNHESIVIGSELDGTYIVRSTGKSTKVDVRGIARTRAMELAKKRAVYDITFSILVCNNMEEKSLKPVLTEVNVKQKHEDYFNNFFANDGEWKSFASTAGTRYLATKFYRTNTDMVCTMSVIVDRKGLIQKFKDDNILH